MTNPIELLRQQQEAELARVREEQSRKLEAITPLVSTRDELADALAVVDDLKSRYAKQWKSVTGGRNPIVSEDELIAAELERPVPVRKRANHVKSKAKTSAPAPAVSPDDALPTTSDGIPLAG